MPWKTSVICMYMASAFLESDWVRLKKWKIGSVTWSLQSNYTSTSVESVYSLKDWPWLKLPIEPTLNIVKMIFVSNQCVPQCHTCAPSIYSRHIRYLSEILCHSIVYLTCLSKRSLHLISTPSLFSESANKDKAMA